MSVRDCQQCNAMTRYGRRCRRITCLYSSFCFQHTRRLERALNLKKSHIPGGGTGLYAWNRIPYNTNIAEYTGNEIGIPDPNVHYPYAVTRRDGTAVDASSTQSTIARYANDCRPANVAANHCQGNNARLYENNNGRIWLRSTRAIPAGQEIFVSYGDEYWEVT